MQQLFKTQNFFRSSLKLAAAATYYVVHYYDTHMKNQSTLLQTISYKNGSTIVNEVLHKFITKRCFRSNVLETKMKVHFKPEKCFTQKYFKLKCESISNAVFKFKR